MGGGHARGCVRFAQVEGDYLAGTHMEDAIDALKRSGEFE